MIIMNGTTHEDNLAKNDSGYEVMETNVPEYYVLVARIQKIAVPIIVTFGLFGNIISATVFLSKIQRKASCSLYIAARCFFDTGFLISLFIVWLDDVGVRAFHTQGICQLVIFFTYICGCLSAWMVVMVTFENYIRICHPFNVNLYCTTNKAIICIVAFTVGALLFYNFPLWTTAVSYSPVERKFVCAPIKQHSTINQFVTYADTVLTLVLPILLIVSLMAAIICRLLQSFHRRARLNGKRSERPERRNDPQSQVTKLLFSISAIFITLTLPSHVLRIKMTVVAFATNDYRHDFTESAVQLFFLILYYFSFSVNIVVYLFFGKTFRKVLVKMYFLWILKIVHKSEPMVAEESEGFRNSITLFKKDNIKATQTIYINEDNNKCLSTDL